MIKLFSNGYGILNLHDPYLDMNEFQAGRTKVILNNELSYFNDSLCLTYYKAWGSVFNGVADYVEYFANGPDKSRVTFSQQLKTSAMINNNSAVVLKYYTNGTGFLCSLDKNLSLTASYCDNADIKQLLQIDETFMNGYLVESDRQHFIVTYLEVYVFCLVALVANVADVSVCDKQFQKSLNDRLAQIKANGIRNEEEVFNSICFDIEYLIKKKIVFKDYIETTNPLDLSVKYRECFGVDFMKYFNKDAENKWEVLDGAYNPIPNRVYSKEEEDLIFKVPEWYQVPPKLEFAARLYCSSYGKRHQFANFILAGPSGVGKTEFAKCFSAVTHKPIVTMCCGEDMDKNDMKVSIVPDKNGGFLYVPSALMEAYEKGWIVEIQEPTLLRPATMASLNEMFDRTNTVTTIDGKVIHRHPDTVVICTTNISYEGCKSVNQSFFSRFTPITLDLPKDSVLVERLMKEAEAPAEAKPIAQRIVKVYRSALDKADELEIRDGSIDFRAMADWFTATVINGEVWDNGIEFFVNKCSLDNDCRADFRHCLESQFSMGEICNFN